MKQHYWQGAIIADQDLSLCIENLDQHINKALLAANQFNFDTFLQGCDRFSLKIKSDSDLQHQLHSALVNSDLLTPQEATESLFEVCEFLTLPNLRKKMKAEFSTDNPFQSTRLKEMRFEQWSPLGVLVQILPGNAPTLGFLSGIEGLLTGNINFLKLSSQSGDFCSLAFQRLFEDPLLMAYSSMMSVVKISSSQKSILQSLIDSADGVVAWGGEEAIAHIRSLVPPRARFIDWGHKISFAYVSSEAAQTPDLFERLAQDVFAYDQQACSSPQCLYIETNHPDEAHNFQQLQAFANKLSLAFENHAKSQDHLSSPSDLEAGEISRVNQVLLAERALPGLPLTDLIEAPDHQWRILIDRRPGLRASPLYRSLWLKPIARKDLLATLRPLRQYLQSVGLECDTTELNDLSRIFFQAGATRIRPIGTMLESYSGEPHDGVFALTRYMKRVSLEQRHIINGSTNGSANDIASLEELKSYKIQFSNWPKQLFSKEDFQKNSTDLEQTQSSRTDLYFKSGGSSGAPKLSLFTYDDYHHQMQFAANGLLAAGLQPAQDRCINLFFSGGLYGGFLSFYTILEKLQAVQFPMAAHLDLDFVGDMIVQHKIDTLLGMPSYLHSLFTHNAEKFKAYRGIKKIFFGGEHLSENQRTQYTTEFGVLHIRSASYGSVDMGPLGFQCQECPPGVHHLHQNLHHLEILKLDSLAPTNENETGRLVFSTLGRQGQNLLRYDIGDLGHWYQPQTPCPCGRPSPRFELKGRQGDIFRASGSFLNYNKITSIVMEILGSNHELQIIIDNQTGKDRLTLKIENLKEVATPYASELTNKIYQALLNHDKDLQELFLIEKSLLLKINFVDTKDLVRSTGSGKLLHIIDERKGS